MAHWGEQRGGPITGAHLLTVLSRPQEKSRREIPGSPGEHSSLALSISPNNLLPPHENDEPTQ